MLPLTSESLETDSAGYAAGFEEKPNKPKSISGKPSRSLVNMGVYVFNRQTLMDVLSDDAQQNTRSRFWERHNSRFGT